MSKINVYFDGANYSMDRSALNDTADRLKHHMSSVMQGPGAKVRFSDNLYDIDSNKLSNATNKFVSHVQNIVGDGKSVTVGGINYSVNKSDIDDATASISDEIKSINTRQLFADGTLVVTDGVLTLGQPMIKSSYGFYYNELYSCKDYTIGYVFHQDHSISIYGLICESEADWLAGRFTYELYHTTEANAFEVEYASDYDTYIVTCDEMFSSAAFLVAEDFFYIDGGIHELDLNFRGVSLPDVDAIYLPDDGSITAIGDYAFAGRTEIKKIYLPKSVNSIGESAFKGCSGLIDINIPSNVMSIGNAAFKDCTNLSSITMPEFITSIGPYTFYSCNSLTYINIPENVTYIGSNAFSYCSSLSEIILPDGVTEIGDYAFEECSGLTSANIPSSTLSIGTYAFSKCVNLTGISFPDKLVSIGNKAFIGCESAFNSVNIPASVTYIGEEAFYGCKNITSIHYAGTLEQWCNITLSKYPSVPWNAESIDLYISNSLVRDIVIPDSITSINNCAFYNCSSLTSVVLPNTITNIGDLAFSGCTNLASVVIPDSVIEIGYSSFAGCSSLLSIDIPNSVTSIYKGAFSGCTSLTAAKLSDSITIIYPSLFYKCYNLSEVNIPNGVEIIYDHAFAECTSLTDITIPDSVSDIWYYAFEKCSALTRVVIPGSVKEIGYYAFRYCTSLTDVILGEGIEKLGSMAFRGCTALTDIVFPSSIKNLGEAILQECPNITNITIPFVGDKLDVTTIDKSTLFGRIFGSLESENFVVVWQYYKSSAKVWFCLPNSLRKVTVTGGKLYYGAFYDCDMINEVVLGDNVTSIGENAFCWNDGLERITIGSGITSIGRSALYGCTKLTEIIYTGTVAQWSAISKGSSWKYNVPATQVVCADGVVTL